MAEDATRTWAAPNGAALLLVAPSFRFFVIIPIVTVPTIVLKRIAVVVVAVIIEIEAFQRAPIGGFVVMSIRTLFAPVECAPSFSHLLKLQSLQRLLFLPVIDQFAGLCDPGPGLGGGLDFRQFLLGRRAQQ